MGRQVQFFALEPDERMLLEQAFSLGAALVRGYKKDGQPPETMAHISEWNPQALIGDWYFYFPPLSDLVWTHLGMVDRNGSECIEYSRSELSPDNILLSGRLFVDPQKLRFVEGQPDLVPRSDRTLQLYKALHDFLRKHFVPHRTACGVLYVGPGALEWHREGGRLRMIGAQDDEVVDMTSDQKRRRR